MNWLQEEVGGEACLASLQLIERRGEAVGGFLRTLRCIRWIRCRLTCFAFGSLGVVCFFDSVPFFIWFPFVVRAVIAPNMSLARVAQGECPRDSMRRSGENRAGYSP